MSKSNQIKKLVNGEIADADDVNQIVEDAGSEGGSIPYDPTTEERSTDGSQSLGSTSYPWGSLKINRNAEFVEVDPVSHMAASTVSIKDLRNFIKLKDCPSSYTGKTGSFPAVNAGESGLEFVNPPVKSNVIFQWNGMDSWIDNVAGIYLGDGVTPDISAGTGVGSLFFGVYGNTYRTILLGKFIKTAGISTVTVNARLWARSTTASEESILSVDVGGHSTTVKSVASATPSWVTSSTIDVSALTNGTTYDITIQLKNETTGSTASSYCSAVVLTGD